MKPLGLIFCLAFFALSACSSHSKMLPMTSKSDVRGKVSVTFILPAPSTSSGSARRREYFSPATTAIDIALKTENGGPPEAGNWTNIFQISDPHVCSLSGTIFYCSTTVIMPAADDIIGAVAYTTTPQGQLSGNIPLSFAEGEVSIASGSSAEPAGAEDPTGRLSITLSPVIYGGQVSAGANPTANTVPIALNQFVDPSLAVIPSTAFVNTPPFANTPYLTDSDTSGDTTLKDVTTNVSGTSIPIASPTDQVELINNRSEGASQTVTATLTFTAAQPDATFTIPAYFGLAGSVSASYTMAPAGSTHDLTYNCTRSSCAKVN